MNEEIIESIPVDHPRLFLTAKRVNELRQLITGSHKWIWERLRVKIDEVSDRAVPPLTSETLWSRARWLEPDSTPGPMANETNFREYGNTVPFPALGYLLTGEEKYLEAAKRWMLGLCKPMRWRIDTPPGALDLGMSQVLIGLSLGYDWLYDALTEAERGVVRAKLSKYGGAMYREFAEDRSWCSRAYLQNHCWIAHCSIGVTGFALYGEEPEANKWIAYADEQFREIIKCLPPDGAFHEGIIYWEYALEHLLKYLDPARELLGVDHFNNEWLRKTAYYRIYSHLPKPMIGKSFGIDWSMHFRNFMSFADYSRDEYGPAYLLHKLAAEYRDPYAQWLARRVIENRLEKWTRSGWLNLLWYDPTVEAKPLSELPTAKHFDDLGLVSMRSGWGDDDALLGFICGPPCGRRAKQQGYDAYPFSAVHVHPDVNSFQLYAHGAFLAVNEEYPHFPNYPVTVNHNTVLVNGQGQRREAWNRKEIGYKWPTEGEGYPKVLKELDSRIVKFESTPEYDYVVGDASKAYPKETGLEKFVRHLAFVKPNLIFIADELKASKPSKFEWILNADAIGDETPRIQPEKEQQFIIKNEEALLQVNIVFPEQVNHMIRRKSLWLIDLSISPKDESEENLFLTLLTPSKLKNRRRIEVLDRRFKDRKVSVNIQDGDVVREASFDLRKMRFEVTTQRQWG